MGIALELQIDHSFATIILYLTNLENWNLW